MSLTIFIPLAATATGFYLIMKLGVGFLLPWHFFPDVIRLLKKKGGAANLSLALAGTLGVGNIVGVAVGIMVGGAGSVFWLVVSALPAALIKYAESAIAKDFGGIGTASCAQASFSRVGKAMSVIYSASMVLLSFAMGAGLQSASLSESFGAVFHVRPVVIATAFAVLVLLVILFGSNKIKSLTSVLIPASTVIYVAISLSSILTNRDRLPEAIFMILDGAFSHEAFFGGIIATLLSRQLKEGFLRGMLSNEAGLGTSSMAHAEGADYTPHEAGLVGVCEVVADTLILCPLTALMLLTSGDSLASDATSFVFSAVDGIASKILLSVSVFFFAFSTVITWISYGSMSAKRLFRGTVLFKIFFLAFVVLGGIIGSLYLVSLVDLIMLPLAAISLLTLIKNSDRVVTLSERRSDL